MVWTPSIRPSWQFDFEDRYEDEDYGVLLGEPRTPFDLKDDQDARDYFMDLAFICSEDGRNPDPGLEDRFLRKAAQRGDLQAMFNLMQLRYSLEHDSEALRWARRILARKFVPVETITPDEIDNFLTRAQAIANWADENSVGTTDGFVNLNPDASEDPPDIGASFNERFTFCLVCGKLKFANADLAQCDDSVHMALRNFG